MHRHAYRHAKYSRKPSLRHYLLALLASIAALVTALSFAVSSAPAGAVTRAPALRDRAAGSLSVTAVREVLDKASLARSRTASLARFVLAHTYTVRSGDSISGVASRKCSAARDWTGIYAASRARHWTARDADVLAIGQHLYLACAYLPGQLRYAGAPAVTHVTTASHITHHASSGGRTWGVTYGYPNFCGDGDGDGYDVPCSSVHHASASTRTWTRHGYRHHHRSYGSSTYHAASGSYEACVIARESGGNSQVMNSSGHYGLYQFDYGTWVSGGGSGADFGHASASEQRRVFQAVYAARGTQPWSPSDGC